MKAELRSLTVADLPDLLDLCATACPLDPFSIALLRNRIFDDPRFDPGLTLGMFNGDRLAAVAAGVARLNTEGPSLGWLKLLAVHPRDRGQGRARMLLSELEQRFRERRIAQFDTVGAPWYFWPGVDVRYTPACVLFESLGFKEHRTTVNMAVDLAGQDFSTTALEAQLTRSGLSCHRTLPADLHRVQAFVARHWPAWVDEIGIAMLNAPTSLFHAERNGDVLAMAAYDAAMFRGTFGPMGTDPSLRGQGVGGVLLKRCLRDMKELGYPRCEIAWTGPVAFYAKQVAATICRVFRDYRKPILD